MSKLSVLALAGALLLASTPSFANKKSGTLYERLGGKKGVTKVVDDFVGRCAKDERINSFFAATAADPTRLEKFKGKLVDQICNAAGGPCKYKGKAMKAAHQGMGIRGEHFDALVEDLVAALDNAKVAANDKGALLKVLGPMKKQIVEGERNTASEHK